MKQKSHVPFSLNGSTFYGIFRHVYQFFTSHVTMEQITKWQTLTVFFEEANFIILALFERFKNIFATRDVPIETR